MSLYFPTDDELGRHTIFPGVHIRTAAAEKMMMSVVTIEPRAVDHLSGSHRQHQERRPAGNLLDGQIRSLNRGGFDS